MENVKYWRLLALLCPAIAVAQPPTDLWGRPIIDEAAQRIFYSQDEFEQLEIRLPKPVGPDARSSHLPGERRWAWSAGYYGLPGKSIMDSADLDGDGVLELIASNGTPTFGLSVLVFRRNLENLLCRLSLGSEAILDHYIFQADENPALELLIATPTRVFLMDGSTCVIVNEYAFPSTVTAVGIGDVDGNGVPDVAFSIGGDLFVSPWNNFSDPMQRRGFGGSTIIVDSLGRSGGDDIAVVGPVLYVLQGNTLETITEIVESRRQMVAFSDLNGDGSANVILGTRWSDGIAVYATDKSEPLFEYPVSDLSFIRTQDLNDDGKEEIILGEGQWGDLKVLRGDGTLISTIDNPTHSMVNSLAVDLFGTGDKDLIWGAGTHLHHAKLSTPDIVWKSIHRQSPFRLAPINSTQIAVSFYQSDSGYEGGGVVILDRNTGEVLGTVELAPDVHPPHRYRVTAVVAGSINAEINEGLCVAAVRLDTRLECHNLLSGELEWSRYIELSGIDYLSIEDFDGDDHADLLVFSNAGVMALYDAANGQLKWESPDLDVRAHLPHKQLRSVELYENSLWLAFASGDMRKLDPANGNLLLSVNDIGLSHIAAFGEYMYGIRTGEGIGLVDLETFEFVKTIYATPDLLNMLAVSEDGEVLMTATGESPYMNPILFSTSSLFEPWFMGSMEFYDVYFPSSDELILSTTYGAERLTISRLAWIFSDRFD